LFLINARSVCKKINDLHLFIQFHSFPEVIVITETWFTEKHNDAEILLPGYKLFQVLANFFESVYVNEGDGDGPAIERTVNQAFSTCTFSAEDLIKALSEKNGMSSPGQDGITYLMLKKGGRHLAEILSMFFQKSLRAGYVPMAWRSAIVKPIFKKGSTEEPSNYRPVCLTSTVGKLMESVIREKMLAFWLENDAINPSQHGFLPNKSCTTNLLMYMDELTKLVDSEKSVDSIYLDFSKAFDTVPHRRLLSKLQSLGIEGSMLQWSSAGKRSRTSSFCSLCE
jgi:hypothetical protein